MRYFVFLALIICGYIFLNRPSNEYDCGYEAAWEGEKAPTWFSSQEYRYGYEQGLQDADMYDQGYFDGSKGKAPKFPKDVDYMDGYKDGKKRL
ncbi:hypothetical protein [Anaplasma marginale]|uniref:hypothetical protein n=1 Tax=Anaplasma marginale TaxID=770 RepID=UPI001145AA4D|nr:hypothetical protein [Anaplasma marginale]